MEALGQVMIDTRRITSGSDLRARLPALLNEAFPVPPGGAFFDDFPIWDPVLSIKDVEVYGAYAGGAGLVAAAGVRFAALRGIASSTVPVALIGAVATDSAWRGRGLATRLVSSILMRCRDRGAAAAFLWGSEHALYGRLGFSLQGEQLRWPLGAMAELAGRPGGALREGWDPEIFALMRARAGGLTLSPADETWISSHKNVRWFSVSGSRGELLAYAALGRGIDLPGLVHEWGGERGALLDLLAALRLREPAAELLGSPWIFERMGITIPARASEYLCLANVLDAGALARAFGTAPAVFPRSLWVWGLDAV